MSCTDGIPRLGAPWNLYVVDLETMVPSMLLEDVSEPRALHWAPDDDRLVFSGAVAGHGDGTWLVRVSDPQPQPLFEDRLDWIAWSPMAPRSQVCALSASKRGSQAPIS